MCLDLESPIVNNSSDSLPQRNLYNGADNPELIIESKKRDQYKSHSASFEDNDKLITLSRNKKLKIANNAVNRLNKFVNEPSDGLSQYLKFPDELFGAMNCGNSRSMKLLVNKVMHKMCMASWTSPAFSYKKQGSTEIVNYLLAMVGMCPDAVGVVSDHSIVIKSNDITIINCIVKFSGTTTNLKFIENFSGGDFKKSSVTDFMDHTIKSKEEIERLKVIELRDSTEGKVKQICSRMKLRFYVNTTLQKIIAYEEEFVITSFRGVLIPI